jgi:hypothetical protein
MVHGKALTRAGGATGALLLALAGCAGPPPLQGRYSRGTAWIEFRSDGTVQHGELGDTARVEIDRDNPATITLARGDSRTTGRILDSSTIEFPPGASPLAAAFAGRWVAGAADTTRLGAEESQRFAAPLLGGWGVPGQPAFLEFRSDGTFSWGKGIGGRFIMLGVNRVRLVLEQNGTSAGQLDHAFTIDGRRLTLTAPDGAVTTYQRVP